MKSQNRFGFVISDETITTNQSESSLRFVGLFELFKQQNLLNKNFLAPELSDTRPNFQSDIYSVFKCFEDILENNQDETLIEIFAKSLSEKRKSRFSKYSEILEELEKVKVTTNSIHQSGQLTIKVVVKQEDKEKFLPTLSEVNNTCYFLIERKLSEGKGQITGQFSTRTYSGRFFIDERQYIFIPANGKNKSSSQKVTYCSKRRANWKF